MESMNWTPAHCAALREHLVNGVSFSEAANRINSKFNTAYTRSAALGRARRMGISVPQRPKALMPPRLPALERLTPPEKPREPDVVKPQPSAIYVPAAPVGKAASPNLRCVEVEPRHLTLIELEHGDCRYPYGGEEENEAITFCGHPRPAGSSYCAPHFQLSRDPLSEGDASAAFLRIVEAA